MRLLFNCVFIEIYQNMWYIHFIFAYLFQFMLFIKYGPINSTNYEIGRL